VGIGAVKVRVEHAFDRDGIRVRHTVLGAARATATLRFPAYGAAAFTSRGDFGPELPIPATGLPAAQTLHVKLHSGRGYTIVFTRPLPSGSQVRVVNARPARSAPRTTRTMVVDVPLASGRVLVEYRLVPDPV
jgi:hypothetical protein